LSSPNLEPRDKANAPSHSFFQATKRQAPGGLFFASVFSSKRVKGANLTD